MIIGYKTKVNKNGNKMILHIDIENKLYSYGYGIKCFSDISITVSAKEIKQLKEMLKRKTNYIEVL